MHDDAMGIEQPVKQLVQCHHPEGFAEVARDDSLLVKDSPEGRMAERQIGQLSFTDGLMNDA
ncbi:hypothetical protein NLM16_37440, partial [Bradyrhizobium brasilense]|uniref:hypothetical protein n=1 Tax=Bradyrhizobium brasilense TaxID=1419277 RepID=UPI0028778247